MTVAGPPSPLALLGFPKTWSHAPPCRCACTRDPPGSRGARLQEAPRQLHVPDLCRSEGLRACFVRPGPSRPRASSRCGWAASAPLRFEEAVLLPQVALRLRVRRAMRGRRDVLSSQDADSSGGGCPLRDGCLCCVRARWHRSVHAPGDASVPDRSAPAACRVHPPVCASAARVRDRARSLWEVSGRGTVTRSSRASTSAGEQLGFHAAVASPPGLPPRRGTSPCRPMLALCPSGPALPGCSRLVVRVREGTFVCAALGSCDSRRPRRVYGSRRTCRPSPAARRPVRQDLRGHLRAVRHPSWEGWLDLDSPQCPWVSHPPCDPCRSVAGSLRAALRGVVTSASARALRAGETGSAAGCGPSRVRPSSLPSACRAAWLTLPSAGRETRAGTVVRRLDGVGLAACPSRPGRRPGRLQSPSTCRRPPRMGLCSPQGSTGRLRVARCRGSGGQLTDRRGYVGGGGASRPQGVHRCQDVRSRVRRRCAHRL